MVLKEVEKGNMENNFNIVKLDAQPLSGGQNLAQRSSYCLEAKPLPGYWALTRRLSSCLKYEKVNVLENGKIDCRIIEKEKYVITHRRPNHFLEAK